MILVGREIEQRIQGAINCYFDESGRPAHGDHDYGIYDNFEIVENENAACILGVKRGIGTVDIRGSNDKKDWRMNRNFDKVSTPYNGKNKKVKVHEGFLDYYMLLREKILDHAERCDTVVVGGHSLGSAVALLAYRDIIWHAAHKWKKKIDMACVQVAGPRVYNTAGLYTFRKCDGHVYLIENGNDPVCNVPPKWTGFRHVFDTYIKLGWEISIFELPILRLLNIWRHFPQAYLRKMKKYNRKNRTYANKISTAHSGKL